MSEQTQDHRRRARSRAKVSEAAHGLVGHRRDARRRRSGRTRRTHARWNRHRNVHRINDDNVGIEHRHALGLEQHCRAARHGLGEQWELVVRQHGERRFVTVTAHRGTAFGTLMQVVVTDPGHLESATSAVERVVDSIDRTCSRFRDDSELSILLAGPGRHESTISAVLGQAIATALRAAELTDGAVDPTVGGAVRNAGYTVDFGALAPDGAPISLTVHPVPGWRRITYSPATRVVDIPAGIEVDLGATAKALASDLAAEAASEAVDGAGVLVSLGGDVAVAGMPPDEGWHVQIAENSRAPITRDGETIAIRSGGVATSSTTVRRWRRGGIELHHIIDPATGLPAIGPWRTVSVVAGNCVDANIAATAAIVRGVAATAWLESAGLPARLVDRSGDVRRVGGWPPASSQTS